RTNFPAPADFIGIEEGVFGDDGYERTLDVEEEFAWQDACKEAFAPLRQAGEAARRAFFNLPASAPTAPAANDPAAKHGAAADDAAAANAAADATADAATGGKRARKAAGG
ncbi:MAG: hypothetical protein KYX64_11905, partial [Sphingopyxis sp.]|nr:hypothetical protein [Sphingopyxis sp.]